QSQLGGHAVIVLHESGIDVPAIIYVVQAGDRAEIRNAKEHRRIRRATVAGGSGIVGELGAEAQISARSRGLEDGELLEAQFGSKFQRMLTAYPGHVLVDDVTILFFDGRQEGGTADGCRAVAKIDLG